MSAPKIVVHTDVFLGHLYGIRQRSVLREAMTKFFCYTTVFQAIELFAVARTDSERKAVEDSMAAMKVMGLNPKQASRYGTLLKRSERLNTLHVLVAGLCIESKLPILTDRRGDFRGIKGLTIVPTKLVRQFESGREVLVAAS